MEERAVRYRQAKRNVDCFYSAETLSKFWKQASYEVHFAKG